MTWVETMNWTCPVCRRPQTVTSPKFDSGFTGIKIKEHALGNIGLKHIAIACANEDCRSLDLAVVIRPAIWYDQGSGLYENSSGQSLLVRRLVPESSAKPQPEYIPASIREDYLEACLIRDLSPKASATLSRRCLQGMIRDFTGVSRKTLNQEIIDLKKLVDEGAAPPNVSSESVVAIDHVRTVGNIGAHMESDVTHIIPVEAGEAQLLIDLIESLFDEWYVERDTRAKRFAALAALADSKKLAKSSVPALPSPDEA